MDAREKAIEIVAEGVRGMTPSARGLAEEIVEDLERGGLQVVERDDAALDALESALADPGARLFRAPDGPLIVVAPESTADLDEALPDGSVELVEAPKVSPGTILAAWRQVCDLLDPTAGFLSPASIVDRVATLAALETDEKGRGPAYQRGRADGRLEERASDSRIVAELRRLLATTEGLVTEVADPGTEALAAVYTARQALAGTEPVDELTQRVETALAAYVDDPTRLRALAGDVVDLAQRTLLGEVDGGHPFPREAATMDDGTVLGRRTAGSLGLCGRGDDRDQARWTPGADGVEP